MRHQSIITGITAVLLASAAGTASAAPVNRVQVTQRGDFVLIGNTLGHDCGPDVPAPVNGIVDACGNNTPDTSPDIFWRADVPVVGQAVANSSITPADARSSAVLSIPAGSAVTHAYLYWAARTAGMTGDSTITLDRPGGFVTTVNASAMPLITAFGGNFYQAYADVTPLVQTHGAGTYRISGVDSVPLVDISDATISAGWWMVVVYENAADPLRNIAVFDGLDQVVDGTSVTGTISGFTVPVAAYNAKLGLIAYDGDDTSTGDNFLWNGNSISDLLNPQGNIFNSSRTFLGSAVTVVGDLPQLTGGARSMSGIDLDVFDITGSVTPGQTQADIEAATMGDNYVLAGIITSISTKSPDLTTSAKSVTDVNGGNLTAGDELEYTIVVSNTGDDAAVGAVLTDPLPTQVDFVPGSISITSGPNMGNKTDAAGDDQGEFVSNTKSVVVRLGTGATALAGGTLDIGASTTVRFRVKIKPNVGGQILNQAEIQAGGALGTLPVGYLTDGNGGAPGPDPTEVTVDSDGDGLSDDEENAAGTDPFDPDSDDDGASDGIEPDWNLDSDGDGIINALDPDSDNDGLFDGTELGLGCGEPGTNPSSATCIPDADMGATTTDPLNKDTDGGGVSDGSEDPNRNGRIDAGEGNPQEPGDDMNTVDSDGDGLSDAFETAIGSNPNDADTDDDGVIDGLEPNPTIDSDGDGLANIFDVDSDNDGLFDGTEMGFDCANGDTNPNAKTCIPDADKGATRTAPLDRDTDDGGVPDGAEDINRNGQIDAGEIDPNDGTDDSMVTDTDMDGLPDAYETEIGSNPNDPDSDDDGVPDGLEPNPTVDTDGDGLINIVDKDSDNDGLLDGTELGYDCTGAGTNKATCKPDLDPTTKTSPLDPDTDDGGVVDGGEDLNGDGKVDAGETDPRNGTDDQPCKTDADCGNATSGRVCGELGGCLEGCRGTGGNGCPEGEECTSMDMSIGECVPPGGSSSSSSSSSGGGMGGAGGGTGGQGGTAGAGGAGGAGGDGGTGGETRDGVVAIGGGCDCSVTSSSDDARGIVAVGLALMALRRRKRRAA